jgi:hypothetical protein
MLHAFVCDSLLPVWGFACPITLLEHATPPGPWEAEVRNAGRSVNFTRDSVSLRKWLI